MNRIEAIIDALGQADMARRLNVHRRNVHAWKVRSSIPHQYWAGVATMCAERAETAADPQTRAAFAEVTLERLATLAAAKRGEAA